MAWNPKGGPWGGGGGPWGGGPSSSPPPNIEEMVRRTQDRVRRMVPGGLGTSRGIVLAIAAVLAIWLATGFYRVQPGEQGVELLFGKFVKTTTPGLNYWFPAPIGEVLTPNVEQTNQITVGYRGGTEGPRGTGARDVLQESLMLTADQNIIDVDFLVQWRIKDAAEYLFNIRDPEGTVKIASESAIREVIGQTLLDDALTLRRQEVDEHTKELLQQILDSYGAGIFIAEVKQQKVDPPTEVIDAFNDVQRARQDQERSVNEANAYRNDIVPRARGEAERIIQDANAYKERLTAEAEGEAKRFVSVLDAYRSGPDLTMRRLYLERMQELFRNTQNVIIDSGANGGQDVVPYLALPELQRRRQEASQ
jgi:modulator of FtsH protease HflK